MVRFVAMSTVKDAKQILFQDSLADVVRQMRNSRKGEQETIQEAIADIKSELRSTAIHVKVTAVVKLTYFAMLGYPGEYGAFNIIEVMSDVHFHNKRAGYVAAAVVLNESSPVLPLCTALLKRDLCSANQYEVGLALYCLSCICTPDLARDLVSDVVNLLASPRAVIRKKAVLCLFKLFLQFPDALRPAYPRLKEKLEDNSDKADSDPTVRGAVVNVLCELARRNPANFLNLVPPFYSLLSSIHNNWTLIKVVKVFGYFAPLEPRLGKKLVEPLTNIITTTHAKSVQYECLLAVANGMSKVSALTKLAVEKMKVFADDRDPNLKYLGLEAMSRIMREQPKLLSDQRDSVLRCISDNDPTIRVKALTILRGMVTKKNLVATVNSMFDNVSLIPPDEEWSNLVVETIIDTVKEDDYANVQDFEWYLAVLMDLAQLPLQQFDHGGRLEEEFVNVLMRVNAVRQFGVESLSSLLSNATIIGTSTTASSQWKVLRGAAYLCGEYPYWLTNKKTTVECLLHDRMAGTPAALQSNAIAAASKILAFALGPVERHLSRRDGEEDLEEPSDSTTIDDVVEAIRGDGGKTSMGLAQFCRSVDPLVQERALLLQYMIDHLPSPGEDCFQRDLFAAEVMPVAEGAQDHVSLPEDVDLDAPFNEALPALIGDDDDDDDDDSEFDSDDSDAGMSIEERLRLEKEKQAKRRTEVDAFYIKGSSAERDEDVDLPPVESLDIPNVPSRLKASGKKSHTISRALSKPANYSPSPQNARRTGSEEPVDEVAAKLRHISVDRPVGKDEALPTIQPYKRIEASSASPARAAGDEDLVDLGLETKRLEAARKFQPVALVDDDKLCASLLVTEYKAKKDGAGSLHVVCTFENKSASNSIYAPSLQLNWDAEDPAAPRLLDADGAAAEKVQIAARVKAEASASVELTISFVAFPALSDVPFAVSYIEKKKERSIECGFPLIVKYFLKPAEPVTSAEFNTVVLGALESAGCMGASVPIPPSTDIVRALADARAALRLSQIDVFKDCVCLHGSLVVRKKAPAAHVAVLVRAEPSDAEGFDTQLSVMVKAPVDELMEGIVRELTIALTQS